MNYQQAQAYLDSLQFHKIKLGLDSMRSFLARVGRPEQGLKYVHVAGTNGKGSVCATLLTILSEAGYRVGLYTSPHLSSVRERFRINNQYISEQDFARLSTRIRVALGDDLITYFEFTTALALLWFAESDLDLVILETGLGGRLDATNVVKPLVSVITNVSMDHEAWLGTTLDAVAGEKAGIIKPGVPVVSGVADDDSRVVVERVCAEQAAPLYLFGREFDTILLADGNWAWHGKDHVLEGRLYDQLRCGMRGSYQVENAALALAVLPLLEKEEIMVSPEIARRGLANVRWPGRLEYFCLDRIGRQEISASGGEGDRICYLLDGAHNPAGVESLVATLREEYSFGRLIVVWGAMIDKDSARTLPEVAVLAEHLILTRPEGERSAEPEQLMEQVSPELRSRCELIRGVASALARAEELATSNDDLIVVAGSLYLIGAVRQQLLGELVEVV
ncbi:MAG: bifunctional folylpolyglutamate synthase/dihydrofolate synthase [Desulfobulbaceae bacterium]|uniref:Dihydrofolate synthase/folylpolyglutamate synthase n=1 Tax=Candidatus Desulfatifera sulfidica TaxID=2841691 RepID=A0A8J6N837_9BACT|nr:bifunctional folylpolyglutamate synthase/dihydrofolate synthase [Candidatus Desulfatifera sulfidica]